MTELYGYVLLTRSYGIKFLQHTLNLIYIFGISNYIQI